MTDDVDRGREHEAFRRIDAAFRAGDFEGLRAALGSPERFPDVRRPIAIGHCLEYAIYHSPLSFIRLLLERGADPNYEDQAGFPSLIAALTRLRSVPGSPARADAHEILELRLLLAHGADVTARTRIDECETPREVALGAGHQAVAELLARHEAGKGVATEAPCVRTGNKPFVMTT